MASEIRLDAPLPELARSAVVRFGDDDRAELEVVDARGKRSKRVVPAAEAHAYLAEVEAFRARVAAAKERKAEEAVLDAARAPVRARLQSELVSTCPHDGDRRRHAGRSMLLTSPTPEGISVQHGIGWSTGAQTFEEYRCPTCGSVELFRPGPLQHPAGPPDTQQ